MRRVAFVLVTVITSVAAYAQLEVKELKLSNGMTVWLNEDHSQPKVFGAVVVKAGAKDCPNTGIAHYFEHIMFKGTDRIGTTDYAAEKPWLDSISAQYDLLSQTKDETTRTRIQKHINELSIKAADYIIPNEYSRLISKYGGSSLNAGTGQDLTYYHNSFLPQFMEQWCWLNSERLMTPVFRGFQGELENVYEEKNRAADDMGDVQDKIFKAVFKTQPYAYPVLGSTENLKNPRLSDMAAFFKKYYVASNMGLILCGDIRPDAALVTLLEKTFGRVQTGPVPERRKSPMPAIEADDRQQIKLPIPLIGAEALVFKAPTEYEADANALDLANMLLYNGKAGLLDSLTNEHKVLVSAAMTAGLDDAAGSAIIVIPNLFGKMKKAEGRVLEQVQQVMDGNFSEEQVEILKQQMLMDAQRELETISSRSQRMVMTFSKGRSWQDVLDKIEGIRRLTKADVVAAARKYYGGNYITLSKKYGTPKKETLKQPGYKPVSPKNLDAKSAFALQLEQIPVKDMAVRTVDFGQDIEIKPLNNHVTLYYKDNPVNDVFTFTLRYKDGELHTPALSVLGSCLSQLGTDSLNRQQLGQAWQRIGATMEVVPGDVAFSINLTGPDKQLVPALRLLAHFLRSAKGDQKALKDAKDEDRIDRKSFGKQKDDVLRPAIHRIAYGERSSYLKQLSRKEVKALKNEDLMALFRELQQYDCELFYCGRQPIEYVAAQAQQALPLSQCTKPQADTFRPFLQYDEPVVYFYHVPKSRQNYIVSYDAIGALPTQEERVKFKLWDEYFGGGMSSVLFQNVREFRSLAYATGGSAFTTSLAQHSDASQGYVTVTGTQADKTLEALSTVDSLLRQLPMKENNLEAARQSVLNDIQNNYPTFRTLGKYVANQLRDGYVSDPNTGIARGIPSVTSQDIMQFHQKHVTSNKNRIWIVIGDRKITDMKALARYGKVVELRKEDVYR
ncbi:Predicted Zn-dependent peptidase [Prevotella communis]|uniref:Predicted Zn-dependent peptidase n=1 Tax=Prevotella communis TaxID=2913614 RepID=A0A1H0K494_9BACT|nr:M16 family metallopeptidase [Prevotella communis]SDO50593.1 Predicted Zn-dependent peptidase [Prevotella communis]